MSTIKIVVSLKIKIVVSTTFGKFQASFFLKEYISEKKTMVKWWDFLFQQTSGGDWFLVGRMLTKLPHFFGESDSAGMKILPEIQPAFCKILLLRPWK